MNNSIDIMRLTENWLTGTDSDCATIGNIESSLRGYAMVSAPLVPQTEVEVLRSFSGNPWRRKSTSHTTSPRSIISTQQYLAALILWDWLSCTDPRRRKRILIHHHSSLRNCRLFSKCWRYLLGSCSWSVTLISILMIESHLTQWSFWIRYFLLASSSTLWARRTLMVTHSILWSRE